MLLRIPLVRSTLSGARRAQVCQNGSQFRMCPQCDTCRVWYLNETCSFVTMARVFDSHGTVFFAVFISLWGTLRYTPTPLLLLLAPERLARGGFGLELLVLSSDC